jgi:hypothetical protein
MTTQEILSILDEWLEEAVLAKDWGRVTALMLDGMLIARASKLEN